MSACADGRGALEAENCNFASQFTQFAVKYMQIIIFSVFIMIIILFLYIYIITGEKTVKDDNLLFLSSSSDLGPPSISGPWHGPNWALNPV